MGMNSRSMPTLIQRERPSRKGSSQIYIQTDIMKLFQKGHHVDHTYISSWAHLWICLYDHGLHLYQDSLFYQKSANISHTSPTRNDNYELIETFVRYLFPPEMTNTNIAERMRNEKDEFPRIISHAAFNGFWGPLFTKINMGPEAN